MERLRGWPFSGEPGRGEGARERGGLDREQVVAAALELLDEVGLDGLTMRRLADRLGIQAASLYWHVQDKEELMELLATSMLAAVEMPPPGLPWRQELTQLAMSLRRALLEHRDSGRLLATLRFPEHAPDLNDRMLSAFLGAGFNEADAAQAGLLITGYVPGRVVQEQARTESQTGRDRPPPSVPPAGSQAFRLVVNGGVRNLNLSSDPHQSELYRTDYPTQAPQLRVGPGTVTVKSYGGRGEGALVLGGRVPWDVQFNGGTWRLRCDFSNLQLRSLLVRGGAQDATVTLPPPVGAVPITIKGGAHKVTLLRPAGAEAQMRLRQGAVNISFDDDHLGSTGGGVTLQSERFDSVDDRYEFEVFGGAVAVSIGTTSAPAPPPRPAAPLPAATQPDPELQFRFGLEVLLDGLERRLQVRDSR